MDHSGVAGPEAVVNPHPRALIVLRMIGLSSFFITLADDDGLGHGWPNSRSAKRGHRLAGICPDRNMRILGSRRFHLPETAGE